MLEVQIGYCVLLFACARCRRCSIPLRLILSSLFHEFRAYCVAHMLSSEFFTLRRMQTRWFYFCLHGVGSDMAKMHISYIVGGEGGGKDGKWDAAAK